MHLSIVRVAGQRLEHDPTLRATGRHVAWTAADALGRDPAAEGWPQGAFFWLRGNCLSKLKSCSPTPRSLQAMGHVLAGIPALWCWVQGPRHGHSDPKTLVIPHKTL